jgi:1-deoxy-D-xylulose-5-phosphate reductoisomerase
VLNSLVGYAGFEPTIEALKAGKKVALANKESLVVGGEIINDLLENRRDQLIPVDSEHSAMLQCLVGEPTDRIEKLIITASGGPFRTWTKKEMANITVEDALDHPNWSMGSKITIDSATMMNKGLEIIEAHWMFNMPLEKIEAVVHPQSVIHSVVTFADGSSKAQLGPPTMEVPILYALTYPDRLELDAPQLDWKSAFDLNFEPVDYDRFPCLRLAIEAIEEGGLAPAILNAANEIAVDRFLNKEITYIDIPKVIESCLEQINNSGTVTLESLKEIDQQARKLALTI